ncbi:MAG: hypothetical protein WBC02_08730 [Candidatus Aminicenantaceae bacterium]
MRFISQLVENHDGVRRQVVIPAEVENHDGVRRQVVIPAEAGIQKNKKNIL